MDAFDTLMFEALDDTLKIILGESVSDLIQSLTKKHLALKTQEHTNNLDTILGYLEKLIGKEGTQVIQTTTMKRLCRKLKQEYEEVESHFLVLDELYEMKFNLLSQPQNSTTKHSAPN